MSPRFCLLCVTVLAGCSLGDRSQSGIVERDSAGIAIVENAGAYEEWQVEPEPGIRIGVVEGDSAYQFHRIRYAGRLGDGRFVVADGSTSEIRWFDAEGSFLSKAGGRGEGPGEFASIGSCLLLLPDTLVVYDPRNQRLTWVTPDRPLAREQSVPGVGSGTVTILGVSEGGSINVAVSTPTYDLSHPDVSYTRDTLTIVRLNATGRDTVLRGPGQEGALWVRYANGRPSAMQQMGLPFAHPLLVAGLGSGIILARSEAHQLEFLDGSGQTIRMVRRKDQPVSVLAEHDRAAFVQRAVDAAHARGQTNTSALEKGLNDLLAAVPEGHSMPSFDRTIVDAAGQIWVRDYVQQGSTEPDHSWTVYGPTGRIRARAMIPASTNVMQIGADHVTGVWRDSLDVEYVVSHAIGR